jgi:hypothetical protein
MRGWRRRDRIGILLGGLAVFVSGASGQGSVTDLHLFNKQGWVRAEVRTHGLLDKRTTLTIESGLPGTCLYLFRLEDRAGRAVAEQCTELSLRYDLWDNRYILENGGVSLALPTLAAADSALSHLQAAEICPASRLLPTNEYRVVLQIAVRPLAPEDRERLSRYVSRNSSGGREEVALDLSVLFGRALDERNSSRPVVRQEGPFFRLRDLAGEP